MDGRVLIVLSRRHQVLRVLAGLMLLAGVACANDDQLIFAEFTNTVYGTHTYNNGWQDWGWVPVYSTNNPTHSGSNALCLAPNGSYQALHFVHGPIDSSLYTSLTFWLNGGSAGGQAVQVSATLGGAEQTRKDVGPAPTNSW